jgi:hypothetical protein
LSKQVTVAVIPETTIGQVHDPTTSRLDAKSVAELFGVTLKELSSWTGVCYDTLKKSPTSLSVQRNLQQLVHSWEILRTVFLDEPTIRNWLNHPIRRLRGQTPLWLLQQEDGINSFEGLAEEFVEPSND